MDQRPRPPGDVGLPDAGVPADVGLPDGVGRPDGVHRPGDVGDARATAT